MKKNLIIWTAVLLVIALSAWLNCDSDSSSSAYTGNTNQSVISEQSAKQSMTEVGNLLPGCVVTEGGLTNPGSPKKSILTAMTLIVSILGGDHTGSLTSYPPMDRPGPCGGNVVFNDYSHSSGKTSGTISFANYCNTESDGTAVTLKGDVSFVDNGTPTDFGPMRNSLTSHSSGLDVSSSAGDSSKVVFSGYKYQIPEPGTPASNASPHKLSIGEIVITDNSSGKSYTVGSVDLNIGNTESTGTGKACASDVGCIDLKTDPVNPIVSDNNNIFVSGAFVAEGANGTTAKINVVPGASIGLQLTEVNGVALPLGSTQFTCAQPPMYL